MNNNGIFNGALAGFVFSRDAWLTSEQSGSYDDILNAGVALATEIDSNIAPFAANPGHKQLMQTIVSAMVRSRAIKNPNQLDYESTARVVAAVFVELATGILPDASGSGGIPMTDGDVNVPQGANFLNELGLGIYRPAAGLMGVASGAFLGITFGNGTANNVDPVSPAVVRYTSQVFNRPLEGTENETAGLYALIDPSALHPQQAALYIDITGNQLDTYGPAIKVIHAGHGDGIYVAMFADGSGYECATWANGSRGYISTIQVPGLPNSTLFNGLWDQADVPSYGMFYADLTVGRAFTARLRAAGVNAGYSAYRLVSNDLATEYWAIFNDGASHQEPDPSTIGVPGRPSPERRLYATSFVGGASNRLGFIDKATVNGGTEVVTNRKYVSTPTAGVVELIDISYNGTVPNSQQWFFVNSIGLKVPNVNDDTAIGTLYIQQGGILINKAVTQGAIDTGGVGFRALVVPN